MISICRDVGAHVILGGLEPPHYAEEYLNFGADGVVVGEGEVTLAELMPKLSKRRPHRLDSVLGLVFRDEAGNIVKTEPRPQIREISDLP